MSRAEILAFIRKHDICVLSTVDGQNNSQSAVVGFSINDDFELTVGTSNESGKFKNIQGNPNVSIVIGWDEWITVQYQGIARVLGGEELIKYQKEHFARVPDAEKYKDLPTERYIAIKPKWLRYTDCNQEPWLTEEVPFRPT